MSLGLGISHTIFAARGLKQEKHNSPKGRMLALFHQFWPHRPDEYCRLAGVSTDTFTEAMPESGLVGSLAIMRHRKDALDMEME